LGIGQGIRWKNFTEPLLRKLNRNRANMPLTAKTTTGILWNFSEQLARRGVGILVTLLLARFLVPGDFVW
jgi:hypothetical protein